MLQNKHKGLGGFPEVPKRVRDLECLYTPENLKRHLFVTFIHLKKKVEVQKIQTGKSFSL